MIPSEVLSKFHDGLCCLEVLLQESQSHPLCAALWEKSNQKHHLLIVAPLAVPKFSVFFTKVTCIRTLELASQQRPFDIWESGPGVCGSLSANTSCLLSCIMLHLIFKQYGNMYLDSLAVIRGRWTVFIKGRTLLYYLLSPQ